MLLVGFHFLSFRIPLQRIVERSMCDGCGFYRCGCFILYSIRQKLPLLLPLYIHVSLTGNRKEKQLLLCP